MKEKPCKNAIKNEELSTEYCNYWEVELNTIEDLIELQKELSSLTYDGHTQELILTDDDYEKPVIEIYDDYRE